MKSLARLLIVPVFLSLMLVQPGCGPKETRVVGQSFTQEDWEAIDAAREGMQNAQNEEDFNKHKAVMDSYKERQ